MDEPVQERTTGVPRRAQMSRTSGRSDEAELTMAVAPPAQAGSMASSPASSTTASEESMQRGTLETGPTARTSQVMASTRPATAGRSRPR